MRNSMLRLLLAATFSLSMVLSLGCGDEDKSIERQLCEKYQNCNLMPAGLNVDTCTERAEKAWNLLTSGLRTDCQNTAAVCIGKADCTNFSNCSAASSATCIF